MSLFEISRLLKDTTGLEADLIGESAIERAVDRRRRERGVTGLDRYLSLLQASPAELQALTESVVVVETSFFRDPEVFTRLGVLGADWIRALKLRPLRLLSLPCSTGEEPYSMSMTLLDAGMAPGSFTIDAIDISERSLAHARIGVYSDAAFRGGPVEQRNRHFSRVASGWKINEAVRSHIRFMRGNLLDESQAMVPFYDVVFCRNLLIYFSPASQRRAIDVLDRVLARDGMLFAGAAETVAFINHGFIREGTPKAFAFRKPGHGRKTASRVPAQSIAVAGAAPSQSARAAASDRAAVAVATDTPGLEESTRLANLGRLDEALQCCQDVMDRQGPSADALHLLGVILDAEGRTPEAIKSYRRAIYLDPHHEEALTHLALLLDQVDQVGQVDRVDQVNRVGRVDLVGRQSEAERLRSRARQAAARRTM